MSTRRWASNAAEADQATPSNMWVSPGRSACLIAALLGLTFLSVSCDALKDRITSGKQNSSQAGDGHDHDDGDHDHPHADGKLPDGWHVDPGDKTPHRDHDHDDEGHDDGAHAHGAEEEKTSRITCWSAGYEVFIEHPFVVANKATQFTTHLTYAATGKPRETGPAIFVLQQSSEPPIEAREDKPARTGIYLPQLVFPRAGDWKVSIRVQDEQKESCIELPIVHVFESYEDVSKASEEPAPEGISFLKEQQWKVLTTTLPVERRDLTQRARVTGAVSACPGHTAALAPPVSGVLIPYESDVLPFVGDAVEANEVCAVVQPPAVGSEMLSYASNQTQVRNLELELTAGIAKAEAASHQAQVAVEQSERALKRTEELLQKKARSQRELEEAQYAFRRAEAERDAASRICASLKNALAQSRSSNGNTKTPGEQPRVEIRSPIAGHIVEVGFHAGERVQPDQAVFTVVDTSKVLITARVPESLLPKLGSPENALYEIPGLAGQYRQIDEASGGRLMSMTGLIDPETRTLPLAYEVPNPEGMLRIGMSVTAHVQTGRKEKALSIPESSIVDEAGRPAAYVMVSGETFAKRDLILGIRDGNQVEVISGIAEGERVVVTSAYAIRLAALSSAIPATGHVH